MVNKLVILSGAGISVASGLKTFRGEDGLWEGHDVTKVASIDAWYEDPKLVLEFYNKRRAQLKTISPNKAHKLCAELENFFEVQVITQNVDDLHERGGSSKVLHLHGQLKKVRSSIDDSYVIDWVDDLNLGDMCPNNHQLRPHIVWFGEAVPLLQQAAHFVSEADINIIIGTSMQVYPAASLIQFAKKGSLIYYIDPKPMINYELLYAENLKVFEETAEIGMELLIHELKTKRAF